MNISEKIEYYIEGKLSPEEILSFEKEMAGDEELSKAVAQRKLLYKAISEALTYPSFEITADENFKLTTQQNIQIEEDLLRFHHNDKNENSEEQMKLKKLLEKSAAANLGSKKAQVFLIMKIAAGFIIVLFISLSILYYTPDSNSILGKFDNQSVCEIFPFENDAYLKNIIFSITLFRQGTEDELPETDNQFSISNEKSQEVLKLSDAITNLEDSHLIQARSRLENLIFSDYQEIRVSALWYYSLLCIKEGKTDEAIQIIKRLSEEKNYYSEKADSLIKIMKRK